MTAVGDRCCQAHQLLLDLSLSKLHAADVIHRTFLAGANLARDLRNRIVENLIRQDRALQLGKEVVLDHVLPNRQRVVTGAAVKVLRAAVVFAYRLPALARNDDQVGAAEIALQEAGQ
ncbi:MAG TPA: hypothetical protein VNX70_20070 [Bryobacteraceae bacterium]|nr:hypothetical protein [Bryobacteraceae bacterium]